VADRYERADNASRSRSRRIAVAASIAIVAPLVAVPIAGRALADFVAKEAGEGLARTLPSPPLEADEPGAEGEVSDESAPLEEGELLDPLHHALNAPHASTDARLPSNDLRALQTTPSGGSWRGLLIGADLVTQAVKSGVRPLAVPAPASGMRPDGFALYGVGGFGAGLRDGDVVTSIAGTPASSVGVLIGAIAGSVQANAKSLSAVVWRGDAKLLVTVEIPPIAKLRLAAPRDP
jgi:hypothetical protein